MSLPEETLVLSEKIDKTLKDTKIKVKFILSSKAEFSMTLNFKNRCFECTCIQNILYQIIKLN